MFEDGQAWKLINDEMTEYLRIKGLNNFGSK